jgi:hypothetical protein
MKVIHETRRRHKITHVEQEIPTLTEYLSSPHDFIEDRASRSLD